MSMGRPAGMVGAAALALALALAPATAQDDENDDESVAEQAMRHGMCQMMMSFVPQMCDDIMGFFDWREGMPNPMMSEEMWEELQDRLGDPDSWAMMMNPGMMFPGMGPGMMQPGMGPMAMGMVDLDNDGVVSADEAAARHEQAFAVLDGNADNAVDFDEFLTAHAGAFQMLRPGMETRLKERFDKLDTNSDGSVTRAEFMIAGQDEYEAADADGDGKVSVWEFRGHRM